MRIICNGEPREVVPGTTVRELIEELGFQVDTIAVQCEGLVLDRKEYDQRVLAEGVELDLIRFVGGGALC